MALKFGCQNCNEDISVRYLSIGEVAECKKCRSRVEIPPDAIKISDSETGDSPKPPKSQNTRTHPASIEDGTKSPTSSSRILQSSSSYERIEVAGKEYELASRGIRWLANILDGAITLFSAAIAYGVTSHILGDVYIAASIGISLFAFGLFFEDGVRNGQSLAKKLCSIRVINSQYGNPCSYRSSFLRNLLAPLPLVNLIDVLCIFGKKRQRLGDKIASTLVVRHPQSDVENEETDKITMSDGRAQKTIAVFAILFVLSFGVTYFADEFSKNRKGEKIVRSTDGQIQVTVPADWVGHPELHDEASIEVGNGWKELYLIVLRENKSDFVGMNLDKYSQITKEILEESLEFPETSEPSEFRINDNDAVQYEIRGISEGLEVVFLHTSVEDGRNYYQVLAWTLNSYFRNRKTLLQEVIQSFQTMPLD
jgi:uncharacterized RDD family membrane protein YckC